MALTYTNKREGVHNNKRTVEVDVNFDDSYPTGGEAVDHAALGLDRITAVETVYRILPDGQTSDRTDHGWNIVPDLTDTSAVLLVAYATTDTEAADEADLSGAIERMRFYGP